MTRLRGCGDLGVDHRIVLRRILRQGGEQRRLGQVELADVLVEVAQRRRLDAVGVLTVEDGVQVLGEDLVLGPLVLELPGEHRLADLALDALLVAHVCLLHELGGERRAALDHAAGLDVFDGGAGDAEEVDAVVFVEALVLACHRGVLHHLGDALARHDLAARRSVEHGDLAPVAVVDDGVLGEALALGGLELGQVSGDGEDGPGDAGGQTGEEEKQQGDDDPHPAVPRPSRLAALSRSCGRAVCPSAGRHCAALIRRRPALDTCVSLRRGPGLPL